MSLSLMEMIDNKLNLDRLDNVPAAKPDLLPPSSLASAPINQPYEPHGQCPTSAEAVGRKFHASFA